MPDPADPTPVRVVARGGKHVVVDKNGKALKKQEGYATAEAAQAVAHGVNATWRDAKSERRSKGGPEITEAWSPESRAAALAARKRKGVAPQAGRHLGDVKLKDMSDSELSTHYGYMLDQSGRRASNKLFDIQAEAKRRGKPHLAEARVVGLLEQIAEVARLDESMFSRFKHPRGRAGEFTAKNLPAHIARYFDHVRRSAAIVWDIPVSERELGESIFNSLKHPRTLGGQFRAGQAVRITGGHTGTVVSDHGGSHMRVRYDDTGEEARMHRVNVTLRWIGNKEADALGLTGPSRLERREQRRADERVKLGNDPRSWQ